MTRIAGVIALAGALLAGAAPAHADRTIPPPVSGDIVALSSNNGTRASDRKCVEVRDFSTADGAPVSQYDCHHALNQRWQLFASPSDPAVFVIRNLNSQKCLEIKDWGVNYGDPAAQYWCHQGANQQWRMTWSYQDGWAQLQNVHSGLCLSVDGLSTANFTRLVQNKCLLFTNQEFSPVYF